MEVCDSSLPCYSEKCSGHLLIKLATCSCPSPGSPQPWSEDCLFVNIFRPRNTKSDAKLPVAVYIHGGAFHAGAGKQRIMEVFTKSLKGSTLSKFTGSVHDSASMLSYSQNPFIIVNFNYRWAFKRCPHEDSAHY